MPYVGYWLENAVREPANPELRGRCIEVIYGRNNRGAWLLAIGAPVSGRGRTVIKRYALVCPEGIAILALMVKHSTGEQSLAGGGLPSLVASEADYHNVVEILTAPVLCDTTRQELEKRGLRVETAEISGSTGVYCYIKLAPREMERPRPKLALR